MTTAEAPAPIARFYDLIAKALYQSFSGWDFSYLTNRWLDDKPDWDYGQIVRERFSAAETLLDMGTGGGEKLATLAPLPRRTWATEGYPPNVAVAHKRLAPLGVGVVPVAGEEELLPFAANAFDLVINRHESFDAAELRRILRPGGAFITQQVGGRHGLGLNEWLQDDVTYEYADWSLAQAAAQLENAGLRIVDAREQFTPLHFYDIGAVVYYLKIIPWQFPDFSVERYHDRLLALHRHIQETGAFKISGHYFWIEAQK
jgi:SAM-dependent methyltransferase